MTLADTQADRKQGTQLYVLVISAIAAVGGFLFGYDTAVIAGTIPYIETYFSLGAIQLGFAVGSALLGCICGATIAGSLADKFGRKKIMMAAALLFLISAVLTALPKTLLLFNVARFIGGIAIGLSSPISPMYIAEIAPARIRGAMVTLNQLAITFGIVAAYLTDWFIAGMGDVQWNNLYGWRWMFGSECVPAALLLIGLFFIPESPRWLLKTGFVQEAKIILTRIEGVRHAETEIENIEEALSKEGASISQLFKPGFRMAVFIGIMLMFFSQVTGMNAIYMYTSKLLLEVGLKSDSAMFGMVLIGTVNFLTTIVAVFVIDKLGRKKLLQAAPLGKGLCMLAVTIGYGSQWMPPSLILVAILGFVFFFALGVGPGVWLVTSEIYPTKVRGRAMSICTFSLWTSCFFANFVFPKFMQWSQTATFAMFTAACFAMVIFVTIFVPETKGKTLEQIEQFWGRQAEV